MINVRESNTSCTHLTTTHGFKHYDNVIGVTRIVKVEATQ